MCATHKPWHIAQHINQQRTTGAADCCNGTECRLHEMAKKTIKSRCNNQSQWSSKGGAPANVECEVQGSLGACHALHKRQRKIPQNTPRSSREELSSNTKPAVKNVGINNGRSALQTRHGEKRFPFHCLGGEVAVGTVAIVTFRTV